MNDMTLHEHDPAAVRTELWLTLARAFRPPIDPATAEAVCEVLADDLADLAAEAGFAADDSLAGLRAAAASASDAQDLLVLYSGLFLMPPTPARLNVGFYLDGTTNGPALDAMDLWRARYGVAQRDDFKDMADHLALQLEFMAYLASLGEEEALRSYADTFLLPALPKIVAALAAAGAGDTLYCQLLAYTLASLQPLSDAGDAEPRSKRQQRRHDTNHGVWRHCGVCAKPFAREKEIRIMAKALAEAGLPAAHLDRCPDCRDPTQGALPSINR